MRFSSCFNSAAALVTSLLISVLGAKAASKDCKSDIQALMKAGEIAKNYLLVAELSMGGQVVQNSEQYYRDYSHFYQIIKQTGLHWLVLDDQEYTSSDGKNWTASQTRDPDWLAETLKRNAETRASIKDVDCGSEKLGDKTFTTYSYVQETTAPVESISTVTLWVDPDTSLPAKRHTKTMTGGQEIETSVRYEWLDTLELPTP
ncbi:hypothetical protein [Roseibium sediminicola]|uniref:Uncharacterized protein n=1 Tax=Roseibium sediminicola TaxID=2933272 RepID=A0ABT0GRZ2_9HYPH|nr:hypothetical protein [Roseibium sp. CAU 1639]MCK7612211.1 hypothetical protein [Roseibium sp. CAU 1639]